jgi:NAD(P)-dependent dehydrogenase (short-subunit alcohol dehydrogenase family)
LIIPIICASVKRLFLMSSAPSQVGQTLHHSEGSSGGQVTAGGRAAGTACDVTREEDLEALIAFGLGRFGRISILVNNAGGGGPQPFDMPMDCFRRAYELNVFSVFRLKWMTALVFPTPGSKLDK